MAPETLAQQNRYNHAEFKSRKEMETANTCKAAQRYKKSPNQRNRIESDKKHFFVLRSIRWWLR